MRPEQEFALEWLHKARKDFLSAKIVLDSDYGITDVPCFHAQQTAEKALKGLLTWHNVSFGKLNNKPGFIAHLEYSEQRAGA